MIDIMVKKISVVRYLRLGGKKKFNASLSKNAIKKKAGQRQVYRLPNGVYVARKPRRKK